MEGRSAPYAAVHETHIGVVFLVGDEAYKLKKPVDLGFIDLSTVRRRREVCRREVELNRRLAPDVYLGLAEVAHPDAADGPEPLVVMRRMPAERRLSTVVGTGEDLTGVVDRLARMLADFHSRSERSPEIDAEATRDAVRARWTDSFTQVRGLGVLPSALLDEIEERTLEFLDGRAALFDRRIAEGRIVDGHGDLLAGDIFCLDDGPRVLDCLEFDDRLRRLDGLDDVAFLAMDLERLGATDLARRLLEGYAEFAADPAPAALRHHYVAYRAFVRAKVAALRAAQNEPGSESADTSTEEARAHAELALRHLCAGRPRLLLVGGLPGTGKSTLAAGLADRLGAVLLSSDRLRKELSGRAPHESAAADYRGGIYTPEHTARTYGELLRRAGELLAQGETVLCDASWVRAADRADAEAVAETARVPRTAFRCVTPAEVTAERMRRRVGTGDASDAGPDVAAAMAAEADPWPTAVDVDTSGTPEQAVSAALRALDRPS